MLLTPFRPKVFEPERGVPSSRSLVLHGLHHSKELLEAVDEHGLVLLRGFPRANNPLHFSAFVQSLSLIPFDGSESAAPRTEMAPYVFTANEAPPSEVIPFHHEMAQCTKAPDLVFFFCQRPARSGGATPVVRSRDVAEFVMRRHPAAARELETRGIRYARTLPEHDDPSSPIGRSWRRTYGATIDEAEEGLHKAGVEGTWSFDGGNERLLRTLSAPRPFFGRDAEGRRTFFNSAVAVRDGWKDARNDPRKAIVYADDDSPLSEAADRLLRDAAGYMGAYAWRGRWHAGDVLLLDNRQVLHARETFRGPRRVMASLWSRENS